MANRSFIDSSFTLIKREVRLYCTLNVPNGDPGSCEVYKWNYPALTPASSVARTYTASSAPSGPAVPMWPQRYQYGAEGVLSVVRTAQGLYTLTLQDAYQRLLGLEAFASKAGGTPVFAKVTENTTISDFTLASGSIIGLAFWDFSASAVDPVGAVRMTITLADATEP